MRFKKTLASLVAGTALVAGSLNNTNAANCGLIEEIRDTSGNITTNLLTTQTYYLKLRLNTTPNPTVKISELAFNIFAQTNYVHFTSATIASNNFWNGFAIDPMSTVTSTPNGIGYLSGNDIRIQLPSSVFPTNRNDYAAIFEFIADKPATNILCQLSGYALKDDLANGVPVTPTNVRFNITAIPEPSTFLLCLLGAGALVGGRRLFRPKTSPEQAFRDFEEQTDRKPNKFLHYYAENKAA